MPTPPPRHLATPRRPWRLLLFVFGLTTALLAALVASATLLPQPEPPRPGTRRRAVDVANQASPDVRVDHHHHRSPRADHRASPFHHCEPWAARRQRTDHDHRTGCGPSAGHGRR